MREGLEIRGCGFHRLKDRPQQHIRDFRLNFPSRGLFWSENSLEHSHYYFVMTKLNGR